MIGNLKNTKDLLDKYNRQARKSFGQNFLIDQNILNKIIEHAEISSDMGVIEIGPGLGALTQHLAKKAKKVLAYEIDLTMVEILEESLKEYDNVKIINQDILVADILRDIELYLNDCSSLTVVANLPYYITTPIIFKFLAMDYSFNKYIFMVQKELADRFTGKPNTKDYNALSVLMEYKTDTKALFNVSPNCFYPAPKVDSVVIEIREVDKNYSVQNEEEFIDFINAIFIQRRKTLVNNLHSSYRLTKEQVKKTLTDNSYSETQRAEELSIEEIVKLFNLFKDSINR